MNETRPVATTPMDLDTIILSDISQTEKDKSYNIIYRWNLKIDTNELTYKSDTESQT